MKRDVFGRPARDCTECRHVEQLHPVGRRSDGSVAATTVLLCLHPQSMRANGGAAWVAGLARDVVCRGALFERGRE